MYIIIFKNGDMIHREEISDVFLKEADKANIEIIDISNNSHPWRYYDGEWRTIDIPNKVSLGELEVLNVH